MSFIQTFVYSSRNNTCSIVVFCFVFRPSGPMLAHKAEEDGVAAVENIAGKPGRVAAAPMLSASHGGHYTNYQLPNGPVKTGPHGYL